MPDWSPVDKLTLHFAVRVRTCSASYADLINTKADADRVYNYPGSLTTPACDEIADWWVVPTPVKLSKTDFERLQKNLKELHVADDGKNARPVQPLNGRSIASLK